MLEHQCHSQLAAWWRWQKRCYHLPFQQSHWRCVLSLTLLWCCQLSGARLPSGWWQKQCLCHLACSQFLLLPSPAGCSGEGGCMCGCCSLRVSMERLPGDQEILHLRGRGGKTRSQPKVQPTSEGYCSDKTHAFRKVSFALAHVHIQMDTFAKMQQHNCLPSHTQPHLHSLWQPIKTPIYNNG